MPTPTTTCYAGNREATLLQVACVPICNLNDPSKRICVHVLLDSGSQCSYITKSACQRLGLRSLGTKSVSILTFGSKQVSPVECEVVRVGLVTKNNACIELKLLSVEHICEPLVNAIVDLEKYPYLKSLEFTMEMRVVNQVSPDILLGSDQYWSLLTGEVIKSNNGPVALNSHLGWILSGPVAVRGTPMQGTTLVTHVLRVESSSEARDLERELHSFWSIESMGIIENESVVQAQFEEHVSFVDGRYVVSLPWKDSSLSLPDNYDLSLRRLNGLYKRLKRDPELLKRYDSVIREQIKSGIVVPVNDTESNTNCVHYMPHHAVLKHERTTTKLRVVYDASAKTEGPSLNECLFVGPSLNEKIFAILVRFSMYPIMIVADIEKAFLMIKVTETDQDVLRFLWYKDISVDKPEIQVLKFTRVVFGVGPSPYLLNATIAQHLRLFEEMYPSTVQKIKQSIYVDDVVMGATSVREAYSLYKESKEIFGMGGFNLRKFVTNCTKLQGLIDSSVYGISVISETTESYAQTALSGETEILKSLQQRVLGVTWCRASDELIVDLSHILAVAEDMEPTKRGVISLVSKIYDPLGLISPVVIRFKILFQELCSSKLAWDEPLSDALSERWRVLLDGLHSETLRIPRYDR